MPKSARHQSDTSKNQIAGEIRRMTAASRYANALFALAQEGKTQPAVTKSVVVLMDALADNTLVAALANPRLTPSQRQQLAASMAKAVAAPQVLTSTLGMLARNNRLGMLKDVLAAYQTLTDTAAGVTRVQVASATKLTDAQRTKLAELIRKETKATDVQLEESLDASLKGGFRAYFNGMVWDASLSGNLARLASRLRTAINQRHNA